MDSWPNLRGFRQLFFENQSSGSKVMDFLSWIQIFAKKNVIFGQFDDVTLIFKDGIGQKKLFLNKKCKTLMAYNF